MASKPKAAPEQGAVTLRQVADDVRTWADTIEGLDEGPEKDQALVEAGRAALIGKDKTESVCFFLRRLEAEQEFLKSEATRITARAAVLANVEKRLRDTIKTAMNEASIPKLEGHSFTVRVQPAGKATVVIENEAIIPGRFKVITVKMAAPDWEWLVETAFPSLAADASPDALAAALLPIVKSSSVELSKTAIHAAITGGEDVPGADLDMSRTTLVIT